MFAVSRPRTSLWPAAWRAVGPWPGSVSQQGREAGRQGGYRAPGRKRQTKRKKSGSKMLLMQDRVLGETVSLILWIVSK